MAVGLLCVACHPGCILRYELDIRRFVRVSLTIILGFEVTTQEISWSNFVGQKIDTRITDWIHQSHLRLSGVIFREFSKEREKSASRGEYQKNKQLLQMNTDMKGYLDWITTADDLADTCKSISHSESQLSQPTIIGLDDEDII